MPVHFANRHSCVSAVGLSLSVSPWVHGLRVPRDRCADSQTRNPQLWRCTMHSRPNRNANQRHSKPLIKSNDEKAQRAVRLHLTDLKRGWILDDPDVCEQVDKAAEKLSRRCGHSPSDFEDLKQDIMMFLLQIEEKYIPQRGSIGAYASTAIKSCVTMRIRYRLQQRRRGRLSNISFDETDGSLKPLDISSWANVLETLDLFNACLLRLSPQQVQLLIDIDRHGQVQTAQAMGISRRQIMNQLDQIRDMCADLADI